MNTSHGVRDVLARLLAGLVLASVPAAAVAQTWSGAGGDALWNNGANWVGGVAPASVDTTFITFGPGAVAFVANADSAWILNRLDVLGPPPFLITGSTLTFDGAPGSMTVAGAGHAITNPIVFNAPLTITAANDITLSGNLSGVAGITKMGPATLVLSGTTTYNGVTTLSAGTLRFGNGATGPGTVFDIVNNGVLQFDVPGGIAINSIVVGSGSLTVLGGLAAGVFGPMVHTGTTTVNSGAQLDGQIDNNALLTLDGTMNTGGTTVGSLAGAGGQLNINAGAFTVGGDNTSTTFSGCISGTANLVKVGTGRLTLAVTCMHNGSTQIVSGTLRLGDGVTGPGTVFDIINNGALELNVPGGIAINSIVNGSGSLTVIGGLAAGVFGPMVYTGPTTINAGGQLDASIINNAPLSIAAGGTMNTGGSTVGSLVGGGQLNINAGNLTVGGDNTSTEFTGCLAGTGELIKVGTGRLTLSGPCTLAGITRLNAGALRYGNGTTGPGTVFDIANNGTLEFNVPGGILINSILIGSGSVTVLGGLAAGVFGPVVHAGTTTVDVGAQLDASVINNALLTVNGLMNTGGSTVGSLTGAGQINLNAGTFTVGGDNTSTTFTGVLAGGGNLVKVGTGRLTLAGANTYAGGTTVNAGSFFVTGSMMGPVTVNAGATFGGTGTVNGSVAINAGGTLSPGLSPGLLNTGNLVVAGVLLEEIEGTTLGTQYDSINVTGTVDFTGGTLVLAGAYVPALGNTFTIITNDGIDAVTGTFAGLAEGATVTLNGATLQISYFGGDGNDVVLTVLAAPAGAGAAIPALSGWSLAILALMLLMAGTLAARRVERR